MRLIFCVALLGWSLAVFGQEDYQSGLLVLKSGRVVSIRGDIEVFGDEVQFTFANGELASLPLNKVDLAATKSRNEEIRRKNQVAIDTANQGEPSLAEEVERWKSGQADGSVPGAEPAAPPGNQGIATGLPGRDDAETFSPKELADMEPWLERIYQNLQSKTYYYPMLFGAVLLVLSSLVAIILNWYLIFLGFQTGTGWGLSLLLTYLVPWLICLPGLSLIHTILLIVYVMANCYGSRAKFLFLLFLPILLSIGLLVAVIALGLGPPPSFPA